MDLKPAKEKKKKKKRRCRRECRFGSGSLGNPFGFGAVSEGVCPAAPRDPRRPDGGGGGGGGGWAPPQLTPEQQAMQARQFEKQMRAFNEQMTQMFKDIPRPTPSRRRRCRRAWRRPSARFPGRTTWTARREANADGSTKSLSAEEAAMKRMFEGIASGQGGMQEMMDNMLKHLLSKDVLYEPMKEIAELYPPWLKKNGKKIPDDELTRFESQLAKTRAIVAAFEDETVEHAEIVRLLQEMQSFGNPPDEIMKEMANKKGMKLDANGVPQAWGLGGGGGGRSFDARGLGRAGAQRLEKGKQGGRRGLPECSIM